VFRDIDGRGTVQKETKGAASAAMGRKRRGSEKTKQAGRGSVRSTRQPENPIAIELSVRE